DTELVEAQVGRQFGDVTGHRGRVVTGQWTLGAAGAPVVDRDDGVVRGQQRYDVAPVRHRLRHAVQQEHRLSGAADRVVDLHAVDLGLAVCEPDSGVVGEVHTLFVARKTIAIRRADGAKVSAWSPVSVAPEQAVDERD